MKRIATALAAVMVLSACGGDPLTGGAKPWMSSMAKVVRSCAMCASPRCQQSG